VSDQGVHDGREGAVPVGETLGDSGKRPADVRFGCLVSRDDDQDPILVSGTAIRGNQPVTGIDLRLRSFGGTAVSFDMGRMTAGPETIAGGPARMHAVSDDQGRFEFLAEEPGDYLVQMQAVDGRSNYGGQMLKVPAEGLRDVRLIVGGASVRGRVVGLRDRQPLEGARVVATAIGGPAWPANAVSDGKGDFEIDVQPGEYAVAVSQSGYLDVSLRLSVDSDMELEIAMPVRPSP
jgi:hypothetical protein